MKPTYTLIGLMTADGVLTAVGLSMGYQEGNPLLVRLMGAIGVIPALILAKGVAAALLYLVMRSQPAKHSVHVHRALIGLGVLYGVVVAQWVLAIITR
jgi:hypothetical protein